jgi:hypothetical protein
MPPPDPTSTKRVVIAQPAQNNSLLSLASRKIFAANLIYKPWFSIGFWFVVVTCIFALSGRIV